MMHRTRWCVVLATTIALGLGSMSVSVLSTAAEDTKDRSASEVAPSASRLPNGRSLSPIRNGVYPQDYFPNTETLAPDEMRIIALGTGMPQVIQKRTKASGWFNAVAGSPSTQRNVKIRKKS